MTQYIDKSSVVADIDARYNVCLKRAKITGSDYWYGKADAYCNVLAILNDTLEVKEVDLEEEINKYICGNFFGSQTLGFFANRTKEEPNDQDIALCAKHFFELGLKAQKGE